MNEIGEELQYARESSGVSLNEASKDLGIKVEILENIEDGRTGAFKDIFELKEYISSYAKYLGLDEQELIDEFNEYMFEYTSKIPIKEIEKTIELKIKEEKKMILFHHHIQNKLKNIISGCMLLFMHLYFYL